jgi:hypothetical protein
MSVRCLSVGWAAGFRFRAVRPVRHIFSIIHDFSADRKSGDGFFRSFSTGRRRNFFDL